MNQPEMSEENISSSRMSKLMCMRRLAGNINTPKRALRYSTKEPRSGTICIEGNVGCGKTTLLDFFRRKTYDLHGKDIFMEPVESWRNVGGENLFEYLYKDPARYSLAFQTYVQLTMIKLHKKQPKLMERSIYSARYCFVENLHKLNLLSGLEYNILDKWFKYLVLDGEEDEHDKEEQLKLLSQPKAINIDLIVYLRCSPQKVMDRIKKRSRSEEKKISFDYIQSLHNLHEDWLVYNKFPAPAPVLILNTDCNQNNLERLYEMASPYILGQKTIPQHDSPKLISVNDI